MSYITTKVSAEKHEENYEYVVDRILFNKTAEQFIEQFNESDYIDFFDYSLDVCTSYCKKSEDVNDYFKYARVIATQIIPALFDRVLCELPQHASAKIKKIRGYSGCVETFCNVVREYFERRKCACARFD